MKKPYLILSLFFILLLPGLSFAQLPTITAIAPKSALNGAMVTVTGTNFDAVTPGNNIVFLGGVKANVMAATATSLSVTVPVGASYAPVTVTNAVSKLTASSATFFVPSFTGDGAFVGTDIATRVPFTVGSAPVGLAVFDVEGDGKPDAVTINNTSNSMSVLINTSTPGTLSFLAKTDIATLAGPSAITVADMNGDGKLDVIVVYKLTNTLSVFVNRSTYTASPLARTITFSRADFQMGSGSTSVAVADITNDGRPDVIATNFTANTVSVFRNLTAVTSTSVSLNARVDFVTENGPSSVAVADLDRDGRQDIVVGNYTSNTLSVFQNNSPNSTTITMRAPVQFAVGAIPTDVFITDADQNGTPDIFFTNYTPTLKSLSYFRNNMTGTGPFIFTNSTTYFSNKGNYTTGNQPTGIAFGDIDGDGKPDVATADYSVRVISVLRNSSTATSIAFVAPRLPFPTYNMPYAIAVNDIDGDGKPDLIAANDADNSIAVYRNIKATTP